MIDFEGQICPVCNEKLTADDDIVVCPVCGCPHHRECWMKENRCGLAELHGTDQQWQRREPEPPKEEKQAIDFICPRCGYQNPMDTRVCLNCGLDLQEGEPTPGFYSKRQQPPFDPEANMNPFMMTAMDMMGGVRPEESIDGVPAGDLAVFIGPKSYYYLPRFLKMSTLGGGGGFSFAAFLFSGLWMIFRKQYKLGGIFLGVLSILRVLAMMISVSVMGPFMTSAGFDMEKIMESVMGDPGQMALIMLSGFLYMAYFAIKLILGFTGNKMYKNFCVSRVREINQKSAGAQEFTDALKAQGNVNMPLALMLGFCFTIIMEYLPYLLL